MRLHQIIAEADDHIDYTGIDPSVIQQLSTYKPHYQQWAIEQIRKGENYNSVIDAVDYYITKISDNRFQNILKKHTPSPKNILSLSLDNIKTAQMNFETAYNRLSRRERDKLKSNVLVDRPGLKIVKFMKSNPGDVDAAKAVSAAAQNTKWCVCNVGTAENYLKQGPLYLLTVDGERYLCHIESNQLMDVRDQPKEFPEQSCIVIIKYIPGFGSFCDDKKSKIYKQSIIKNKRLAYFYARDVIKGRWPEAEPYIMQEPQWAKNYAHDVINGRWPEAEPTIMEILEWAYQYARDVIRGRWPQVESKMIQNPVYAYDYARWVIKDRWPKAEPTIMQNVQITFKYARDVINGRWPEAEPYIMKNAQWAYEYAFAVIKGKWPEAEPYIMKNTRWAYNYAFYIIKGRWPKAEPYIMQDPEWACAYAHFIIKDRWPQAEPTIIQDSKWAYYYARDVIKDRWPQAEPTIIQDSKWAYDYALNVIKGRWPEAEPNILNSSYTDNYKQRFKLE